LHRCARVSTERGGCVKYAIGARVFACLGTPVDVRDGKLMPRANVVRILGPGTFQGMDVPPTEIVTFNLKVPTETIVLDSGKTVWGCECWLAPFEAAQQLTKLWRASGFVIRTVDIDDVRRERA
jgi:hypothetical protein